MAAACVEFPLVHSAAESIPLPDASFDIVFCDHGAIPWADPLLVVPEVGRVLRRGGVFAFSHFTPFSSIWRGDAELSDRLEHEYFGMHRIEDDDGSVHFQLPYGEWVRLFRRNGFRIERLIEIRPEEGAASTYVSAEATAWARRWPLEEIWQVRRWS